jgi:hypothetical protein
VLGRVGGGGGTHGPLRRKLKDENHFISYILYYFYRMQYVLIGSSNVQRFYSPETYKNHKPFGMLKTCNLEVFKTRMNALQDEKGVVIQVIENLLEDAVKGNVREDGTILEDVLSNTIKATIKVVMKSVKVAASRMPETKFALIMPILRPCSRWYSERFDQVTDLFSEAGIELAMKNVRLINCFATEFQLFDDGNLHLTNESGAMFVEAVLGASEAFFMEEDVGVEEMDQEDQQDPKQGTSVQANPEGSVVQIGPKKNSSSTKNKEKIAALENRVKTIEEKCKADNLVFARDREDLDAIANEKKEDRLIITGLTNPIPRPTNEEDRKKWLDDMVIGVLSLLDPEGNGTILFAKQGRGDGHSIPMVEVRMDSKETAKRIRASYANKKKNSVDLGRLFVANCVTLATRVRADILRAIANKLNKKGGVEMYVTPFSSRPVLHVKDMSGNKAPYALTFADAVTRYGSKLEEGDLGEAYRRAGKSFDGQLSQLFVVLKEDPNNVRVIPARGTGNQYRGTGRGNGAPRGGNQERGRGNYRGYGQGRAHADRGRKRTYDEQSSNEQSGSRQTQNGYQSQLRAQNQQRNPAMNVGYAVKRQNLNN